MIEVNHQLLQVTINFIRKEMTMEKSEDIVNSLRQAVRLGLEKKQQKNANKKEDKTTNTTSK